MSILSRLKWRRLDHDDFRDETRAHLAIAADERIAEGADRRSAELAARKDFGNVTLTTDAARRVWTPRWIDILHDQASDVRYAIRGLGRDPIFSLTVVAVLTIGIGLNAAVFTMLKGVALSPLSGVDRSARLRVLVGETGTGRQLAVSYPDYVYLRDHDRAFSGLFGSNLVTPSLGRGRNARVIGVELVTGNYFQILGVRAEQGRTLLPSDEIAPGRHPVIVLSDGLWRRQFAAAPDIIGKTVEINSHALTVVGVSDPAYHGTIVGGDVEAFIPVMMAAEIGAYGGLSSATSNVLSDRRAAMLFPHGFLQPGTTLENAAAQTDAIWATLSKDRPLADAAQRLKVVPFSKAPTGGQQAIAPTLAVLSGVGLLVLLLACANIAGLALVRGVSRRGEVAMRLALGATRMRIVRLLLTENVVLAVPAAGLGILLAQRVPVLFQYAQRLAAPQRLFMNTDVDQFVIGFAVLVACASALVCGFLPALQTTRVDLVSVINEDAPPRGAARGRLRAALVVGQVAVSLMVLVGSGLVTRSLDASRRADPGFDANHVTALQLDVRQNGYDESRGRVFYRSLVDASRTGAGIESATLAAFTPLAGVDTPARRAAIAGYEPRRGEDLAFMWNVVGSDYFRTLRIPMLAGRAFEDRDDEAAARVTIVNGTLAQRFWGAAANALGKRIRVDDGEWRTVIGVAADVKYTRINEPPRPYFYLPFLQSYRSRMMLHTRGGAPMSALLNEARARVAALDADLPLLSPKSLAERTEVPLLLLNLTATLLFVFGTAGMALAGLGTYGLVSYTVKQSTREIGIRMAMGATSGSVLRRFLGRGVRLGAIGAAAGIAGALAATRMLGAALYGVSATDPVSFLRALGVVLAAIAMATLVPAWRAARANPLDALRHQ